MTNMFQPYSGSVYVKGKSVIWEMSPDEARELADFFDFEAGLSPEDLAHEDAKALRYWANTIDGKEKEHGK